MWADSQYAPCPQSTDCHTTCTIFELKNNPLYKIYQYVPDSICKASSRTRLQMVSSCTYRTCGLASDPTETLHLHFHTPLHFF